MTGCLARNASYIPSLKKIVTVTEIRNLNRLFILEQKA